MEVTALSRRALRAADRYRHGISYTKQPRLDHPISQPCSFSQLLSPEYTTWCSRLGVAPVHHRKRWEWVYILQVLGERNMLRPGIAALGFGVGVEPIVPYLASQGVQVLATDPPIDAPRAAEWRESREHAAGISELNPDRLCEHETFVNNVSYRAVDMRELPDDLGQFDFAWSSCAMEHLGSLETGLEFFERHLTCLKPGGLGVHTTEYNVAPDGETLDDCFTVLYQRDHLEKLVREMRKRGHHMQITFACGTRPEDLHVDKFPFTPTHIRTETLGYIHTSFGLVVQRARH